MTAAGSAAAMQSGAQRAAAPQQALQPVPIGSVRLLPGTFAARARVNRDYVASLDKNNLLQNFRLEAGLWSATFRMTHSGGGDSGERIHWGWESPTCQLRGHFLGHWLSAAYYLARSTSDTEVAGKAQSIVAELARVQKANGGRWVASIPEKYLDWVARKRSVWAPHYTIHKTLMGLVDAYSVGGNEQALEIAENWAPWFHEWTSRFSREQMDDILDVETGGMLESWSDLYGITGKPIYRDLMERYTRRRLFDPLLENQDVLTNKHANTTIPEAHGAARAYEVTGDTRWRDIALAYWRCAVTTRGAYATGGQTAGEIWTPPHRLAARLGDKNQEHCVVYNMIRLADYLFRWTGEPEYADYIERNLHNGILAQQHPETGMVSYFLPLAAGSRKRWGSPTNDFWCCHGSLVQAHTRNDRYIYFTGSGGLTVAQYIPSEADCTVNGSSVRISQSMAREAEDHIVHSGVDAAERPKHWAIDIRIEADQPTGFALRLRMPSWLRGRPSLSIDGRDEQVDASPSSFLTLKRTWGRNTIRLLLPKGLTASPLPDRPGTVAFLDGPVLLAALSETDASLHGDVNAPEKMLAPDNEREWATWLGGYRTVGQEHNLRFVPLNTITDEAYTVYFPVAR